MRVLYINTAFNCGVAAFVASSYDGQLYMVLRGEEVAKNVVDIVSTVKGYKKVMNIWES